MDANNLDLHLQTQTHKKQTNNQPNQTKQNKQTKQANKTSKRKNKQTNKQKQHTRIHIHTHCSPSKRLTLVFENAVMTMTIAPFSYHRKE
jgi:flagellar biosynthesis/type III secretory pathway M-ring protein FliF/YscJ